LDFVRFISGLYQLHLTPRAVVGAAAGTADLFDGITTALAGGAMLPKDFEVVGEVAVLATGINEVLEGGATHGDGFFHDVSAGSAKPRRFSLCYSICSPRRPYPSAPECLIDVDIAETGDELLIQERCFNCGLAFTYTLCKPLTIKLRINWLRAKPGAGQCYLRSGRHFSVPKETHVIEVKGSVVGEVKSDSSVATGRSVRSLRASVPC
jgi:hypothetical protein